MECGVIAENIISFSSISCFCAGILCEWDGGGAIHVYRYAEGHLLECDWTVWEPQQPTIVVHLELAAERILGTWECFVDGRLDTSVTSCRREKRRFSMCSSTAPCSCVKCGV